jgi:hypothetical protein
MGWQEELRRLDVELATGRITHESHRKQRDELLAAASGGGEPSPVVSPLRHPAGPAGQRWQDVNLGPRARPTAPLPHPPVPAPPVAGDRQTTAPSPADLRPTDAIPVPRPNSGQANQPTVILPAVLPPHPSLRKPAQAGAYRPIDESFQGRTKNRGKPIWLFIAAGVLLVLALIAGGMWWITDKNGPTGAPPAATLEARLPTLPGTANPNNSTMSVAKGLALGLYSPQTADTLTRNGTTEVIFRSSAEGTRGYLVMVIPTSGAGAAQAVVEQLYQSALASGFTQVQSDLRAATGTDGKTRWDATWYASGATVVSVGLSQPASVDQATLTDRQVQTVSSMRNALPPG